MHLRHTHGGRLRPLVAVGLLPLAFTTACSMGSSAAAQPADAVATPAFTSNADAPANAATLTAATSPLGKIVVDHEGFTLYRFDHDTATPSKATCDGECALTWLPVPAEDSSVTVEGLGQGLVGEVRRSDNTEQLTLAGWPLYRYAPDQKPGDTTGQGQGGLWFAIGPDGKKVASSP